MKILACKDGAQARIAVSICGHSAAYYPAAGCAPGGSVHFYFSDDIWAKVGGGYLALCLKTRGFESCAEETGNRFQYFGTAEQALEELRSVPLLEQYIFALEQQTTA